MKKTLVQFLLAVLVTAWVSADTNAQTTKYTWSKYGVSFSIPNSHEVIKNVADEFESGDELTWLQMYPFEDESATAQGMVQEVVKEGGYNIVEEGEYTSGGYDGYWIQCTSDEHPEWEYWLIGFIDPDSATNFYAIIWWKKDNQRAYDIANTMSYSFKKVK